MEEIWKDVKNYEGYYQVSNLGRVKSLAKPKQPGRGNRARPEMIMQSTMSKTGYVFIQLKRGGSVRIKFPVHRLVSQAFIPNPENKPEVHHINHIRDDNRVENLEWATTSEQVDNHRRMKSRNTQRRNQNNGEIPVIIDGVKYQSHHVAAEELDIVRGSISYAVRNNQSSFRSKGKIFKLG